MLFTPDFKLYLMELKQFSELESEKAQSDFKLYLMELKQYGEDNKTLTAKALNCTLWN